MTGQTDRASLGTIWLAAFLFVSRLTMCFADELQVTRGDANHVLTNVNVWSPDSRWIYYDVRSDEAGAVFDCDRIERVCVSTGKVETVYQSKHGACVGVVTASPSDDRIVFIHGPEHPTFDWGYAADRRRGVIASPNEPGIIRNLDARDLTAPFTPGALRGGTHVHVFSGDGQWVSFTYEDNFLATVSNAGAQGNQRGVGVAVPIGPVQVPRSHSRNHDGEYFSVLVTRTMDHPAPGSDEINRAYEDAWIGTNGYIRADGQRQTRALALIGDCLSENGDRLPELFVVDIPDDVTIPSDAPLCGTEATRPTPPRGARQRRLTYTGKRKYPGIGGPRHWPRSNPEGTLIACLMRDDSGITQLWLVSPVRGELRQLTRGSQGVASAFSFRPDGQYIACVIGDTVCEVNVVTGAVTALTSTDLPQGRLRPEACVYSPDGRRVAYVRTLASDGRRFNHIFVTETGLVL